MIKKIYIVSYSTKDNYHVVSNFFYLNKTKAEEEAKKYTEKSTIFRKYEIQELCPA